MTIQSRPEKLAELFGGKSVLASICEISPSIVTRWCKRGAIDPSYNVKIKRALGDKVAAMQASPDSANHDASYYDDFVSQALACLDEVEICPHCGQPMTGRRLI